MKRVLFVDDDPLVLQVYTKKLEQGGYEVQTATDGVLAMKAMRTTSPDVMVLDLMMPRLSGNDVLKFMAGDPRLANVCVVVLSSSFLSEQARISAPFRISRAVTKGDCTPARLLELINQLLGVNGARTSTTPAGDGTSSIKLPPA